MVNENRKIRWWMQLFSSGEELAPTQISKGISRFVLSLNGFEIGRLSFSEGVWKFTYSDDFKKDQKGYRLVPGFKQLDKEYSSDVLWPFFEARIPGLGQPSVHQTLMENNLKQSDVVGLLRHFGKKVVTNPYQLDWMQEP